MQAVEVDVRGEGGGSWWWMRGVDESDEGRRLGKIVEIRDRNASWTWR